MEKIDLSNIQINPEPKEVPMEEMVNQEAFEQPAAEEVVEPTEEVAEVTEETTEDVEETRNEEDVKVEEPVVEEPKVEVQPEPVVETKAPEHDEFLTGLIEYYNETGDITPYLEAKTVDYDSMSDKDVFARELKSKYENISDKAFASLLDRELNNRFGDLEEYVEEGEMSLAQELLKAEADKLRRQFKETQSKFAAPQRESDEELRVKQEAEAAEAQAKAEEAIMSNAVVKEFLGNKTLKVKYGGEEFNFEPKDKDSIMSMTKDLNSFMQLFATGNEANPVDFEKWLTVVSFAQDPDNFLKGVRSSAKAVASDKVLNEIRNPIRKTGSNTTTQPQGSVKDQLLAAALKSKK